MKKYRYILLTGALCMASLVVGASAADVIQRIQAELRPDFTVIVDGQRRTFANVQGETVQPLLYNGTTYLPLRAVGELMGKTVYWYEDTKTIELKDDSTTVTDADVIVPENSGTQSENSASNSSSQSTGTVTQDQAKAIALKDAGVTENQISRLKIKPDWDNGTQVYDVEFYAGKMEYSYEIRVSDGQILERDVDYD